MTTDIDVVVRGVETTPAWKQGEAVREWTAT